MVKRQEIKNMITASEVAEIWKRRSKEQGKEIPYTRFSVYGQKDKLGYIDTPLGFLYEREKAETIELPRYNPRPDVAKKNRDLYQGKKRDKKTNKFLPVSENSENS